MSSRARSCLDILGIPTTEVFVQRKRILWLFTVCALLLGAAHLTSWNMQAQALTYSSGLVAATPGYSTDNHNWAYDHVLVGNTTSISTVTCTYGGSNYYFPYEANGVGHGGNATGAVDSTTYNGVNSNPPKFYVSRSVFGNDTRILD